MQEEKTTSENKLKSYFNIMALIAVLVIAPLISWIYLKKGVEYRKAGLESLTPKSLDQETLDYIAPFVNPDGQAKLIHLPTKEQELDYQLLYEIDDRIIEKPFFEIIAIGGIPQTGIPEKINNISFQQKVSDYTGSYDYILLDTSNTVRATYFNNKDIAKDIIRHLSIVIPMQKKKSIELKRQKKKQ